jgi:hypothetical protein
MASAFRPTSPSLSAGLNARDIPPVYRRDLSNLLVEAFGLPWVAVGGLREVTFRALKVDFTS